MARSTLNDMYGFADPVLSFDFDLIVANPPGGGSGKALTVKCKTSAIPGQSFEPVEVAAHGYVLKYAGRPMFPRTLPFSLYETTDMSSRDVVIRWMRATRNYRTGVGGTSASYKTTGEIHLYNSAGTVIRIVKCFGMWVEDLSDSNLDGATSDAVSLDGSLSYDYAEDQF